MGSEKENGDVKITKRFGIPGKWETVSPEEREQRIAQEEHGAMGNTNDKILGSLPLDNSDCLVPDEDVDPELLEQVNEYYDDPEVSAAMLDYGECTEAIVL